MNLLCTQDCHLPDLGLAFKAGDVIEDTHTLDDGRLLVDLLKPSTCFEPKEK